MAEEKKAVAKTALKVVIGIALLVLGAWLIGLWKVDVLTVIRGFLGMAVILAGVITLAIAKE
ncbi:MAG: hypothetical protein JW714_01480 [Candidatus Omnitrophica bacterium]|nr:hypothetical protein [Candidatus Omnitrophota bacterium]